jgi:hypothetical protein
MPFRMLINEKIVYEGLPVPVPRVGDMIFVENESVPIESATWDFRDESVPTVNLVVGSRPYTF